tara:strand:+ start:206 stop:424 length:219 start_codon:yes stop_codon:yes gene_type:complete
MDSKHTDKSLTLHEAWENAASDMRGAEKVYESIVSKLSVQTDNELEAHEAARTLIGFYQALIFDEKQDDESL